MIAEERSFQKSVDSSRLESVIRSIRGGVVVGRKCDLERSARCEIFDVDAEMVTIFVR
jgi:hypothetical protein